MNVHHLELFYYVARHGGISQAVRNMPYGIQQPAVSGQILQLEEDLGVKLFNRRPFALTPAGEDLYAFIQPFFGNLDQVAARLKGEATQRLRVASSITILRDHVPGILLAMKKQFPNIRPIVCEANQAHAEALLHQQEIDLAITEMDGRPAQGLRAETLAKVPLVLLVPANSEYKAAKDVWTKQSLPFIGFSEKEMLTKIFQRELERQKVLWPISVHVSNLDLIETYTANGLGAGASLQLPGHQFRPEVRALPLPGFPPMIVAALWQGKLPPLAEAFLKLVRQRATGLALH